MGENVHATIVKDDSFARNWMTLVAVRDWHTRVVSNVHSLDQLPELFKECNKIQLAVDFVILDTDISGGENWIPNLSKTVTALPKSPKTLCTGFHSNPSVLNQLNHPLSADEIVKDEILYLLAWVIPRVVGGNWAITESVQGLAVNTGFNLPRSCLVLDYRQTDSYLSERQAHVACLMELMLTTGDSVWSAN